MPKERKWEIEEKLRELQTLKRLIDVAQLGEPEPGHGGDFGSLRQSNELVKRRLEFLLEFPEDHVLVPTLPSEPGVTSIGLGARVEAEVLPGGKFGSPKEVARGFPLQLSFSSSPAGGQERIGASIHLTGSLVAKDLDGKPYLCFDGTSSKLVVRDAVAEEVKATVLLSDRVNTDVVAADFAKCHRLSLGANAPSSVYGFPDFDAALTMAAFGDAAWYEPSQKNTNKPRMVFKSNEGTLTLYNSDGKRTVEVLGEGGDIHLMGGDCAEEFDADGPVEPGTVVVAGERVGSVVPSSRDSDKRVVGIVSGANGLSAGIVLHSVGVEGSNRVPVALAGKVWCKASANAGAIGVGDLLVSSEVEGHARGIQGEAPAGTVIGKSLSRLESGLGLVLALVMMR